MDSQGRLYTCETHSRRVTRTDKKGKIEVLAERWQGKRLNAPNDIVVRKDGEIYFTDPTHKRIWFIDANGKKRVVKRKLYPGYLVAHMEINEDTWFLVRETRLTGATGFSSAAASR